jgi:hypothetical protein
VLDHHGRPLYIDESLNPRLAREIKRRGRNALSPGPLRLKGSKDPDLLRRLFSRYAAAILVSGDDHMPEEHADVILEVTGTIAIIDPEFPARYAEEQWQWDVVQRWAHVMQEQKVGTCRRYSLAKSVVWTPRTRKARVRVPKLASEASSQVHGAQDRLGHQQPPNAR